MCQVNIETYCILPTATLNHPHTAFQQLYACILVEVSSRFVR